jgi:hypothetical protein
VFLGLCVLKQDADDDYTFFEYQSILPNQIVSHPYAEILLYYLHHNITLNGVGYNPLTLGSERTSKMETTFLANTGALAPQMAGDASIGLQQQEHVEGREPGRTAQFLQQLLRKPTNATQSSSGGSMNHGSDAETGHVRLNPLLRILQPRPEQHVEHGGAGEVLFVVQIHRM